MSVYYEVDSEVARSLQRELPVRVFVTLTKVTETHSREDGKTTSTTVREVVQVWALTPDDIKGATE